MLDRLVLADRAAEDDAFLRIGGRAGQRRMAESDARAKQIMEPVNALGAMADELDRELNKSVS